MRIVLAVIGLLLCFLVALLIIEARYANCLSEATGMHPTYAAKQGVPWAEPTVELVGDEALEAAIRRCSRV